MVVVFWYFCMLFYLYFVPIVFCYICILVICILSCLYYGIFVFCFVWLYFVLFVLWNIYILSRIHPINSSEGYNKLQKAPIVAELKIKRWCCTFTQSIIQFKSLSKSVFQGLSMLQSCVFLFIKYLIQGLKVRIEKQSVQLKILKELDVITRMKLAR